MIDRISAVAGRPGDCSSQDVGTPGTRGGTSKSGDDAAGAGPARLVRGLHETKSGCRGTRLPRGARIAWPIPGPSHTSRSELTHEVHGSSADPGRGHAGGAELLRDRRLPDPAAAPQPASADAPCTATGPRRRRRAIPGRRSWRRRACRSRSSGPTISPMTHILDYAIDPTLMRADDHDRRADHDPRARCRGRAAERRRTDDVVHARTSRRRGRTSTQRGQALRQHPAAGNDLVPRPRLRLHAAQRVRRPRRLLHHHRSGQRACRTARPRRTTWGSPSRTGCSPPTASSGIRTRARPRCTRSGFPSSSAT